MRVSSHSQSGQTHRFLLWTSYLPVVVLLISTMVSYGMAFQQSIRTSSRSYHLPIYQGNKGMDISRRGRILLSVSSSSSIQQFHQNKKKMNHNNNRKSPFSTRTYYFPLYSSDPSSSSSAITPAVTVPTNDNNDDSDTKTTSNSNQKNESILSVLWRFSRPHTIIGSALAIPALHFLAAPSYMAALSTKSFVSMGYAMIPALLMNLYITGLNQITDVDIDKINKPDLPLAAGHLTMRNAIVTTVLSLILSLVLGMSHPTLSTEGLNVALIMSAVLGTCYSLPPIRLKRFPFWAAFCIVAVRGAVINAGFFAHAKVAAAAAAFSVPSTSAVFSSSFPSSSMVWQCLTTNPACYLSSLYFALFGVVIALMKDVPDVKGDHLSNVRTLSVRLGPQRVYRWMHRFLTAMLEGVGLAFFRGAVIAVGSNPGLVCGRTAVGLCSILAGVSVQRKATPVDPENPKQVYDFYMHLWKLFYLSYLVLPLAR